MSVGTPIGAAPEEDERRLGLSTNGKERAEVRISGHQDSVLLLGQREHLFITGGLHADFADMDGVVSGRSQTGSNAR